MAATAAAAATPPGQVEGSQLKVLLVGKVMNSRSGYSSAGGS